MTHFAVVFLLILISLSPPGRGQGEGADADAPGPKLRLGPRLEHTHRPTGHESHLSAPAVAATRDGLLVAWAAEEHHGNALYLLRASESGAAPVRVNPHDLSVEALHHSPLLAVGKEGEVYVSWSSAKAKPAGALFASDLRLSRSRDGGRTFDSMLQVNEDRPISHSFDALAVLPDGTVLVSWIDNRAGVANPETWLARVVEQGTRVEQATRVDVETCVCCRVGLGGGPAAVAVLRRKVYPGDIRDMAISLSRDGGRTFAPPARVHDDGWHITACPHRGGQVALDARGRLYTAWYTEGRRGVPTMLFATSADGQRFSPPRRLDASTSSVPDHLRLAINGAGGVLVAWEDATAVRRRILARASADGGRTFGPVQTLSRAIKAYAPDVKALPSGEFAVAWHEEQFPHTKTIVQTVTVGR